MTIITLHVIISGRVQGVGYRAWTASNARKLGLDGWVRNRRDGTVEAVFSGENAAVQSMLAACREGPMVARVTDVVSNHSAEECEPGFRQRETV
jgi:acylphosphatase